MLVRFYGKRQLQGDLLSLKAAQSINRPEVYCIIHSQQKQACRGPKFV